MPEQEDPALRFLHLFPATRRSKIANDFLEAIRHKGFTSPDAILGYVVKEKWQRQLAYPNQDPDRQQFLQDAVRLVRDEVDAARDLALHYVQWEALPADERERIKEQRAKAGQEAWMAQQPPTESQLRYLSRLGYTGEAPISKAEASRLIDGFVSGGGK